jgi:hypothetical protein
MVRRSADGAPAPRHSGEQHETDARRLSRDVHGFDDRRRSSVTHDVMEGATMSKSRLTIRTHSNHEGSDHAERQDG